MTHIQSIFDLCPDIQEQIGKELAPLVKSKKLKMRSIHKCRKLMEKYDMPKLEDFVFEKGRKNHIGRMLLFLIKKKALVNHGRWLHSLDDLVKCLVPDFPLSRLDIIYHLIKFPNYICKGEELNMYGLKWKTCKNFQGTRHISIPYGPADFVSLCYVNLYRRPVQKSYTSKQLDEIAEPLGIKNWRKHWKKDKKIHHLMKTEV